MTTAPPLPGTAVPDDVEDLVDVREVDGAVEAPTVGAVGDDDSDTGRGTGVGRRARPSRPAPGGRPRAPRTATPPAGKLPSVTRAVGMSLTVLAVLLGVVLLYTLVFAGISETRAQDTLFKTFRGELAQGIAPVGPAPTGAPVAIMSVPRLGLRSVVVEGTASGELLHGPGHRRDTPLPGQPGTSVVYGRSTLAGHPFSGLDRLRPGDQIVVTTGQADRITFVVVGSRDSRDPAPAVSGSAPHLNLVTADPPLQPTHTLVVSAVLTSEPLAAGPTRPAIGAAEKALGVDGSALLNVALWLQVLVLLTAATTAMYLRGPRWTVYLISTPVLVAVVWNIAENLVRMLPNVV